MPYIKGRAKSYEDLIEQIIAYVTDESIHGDDAWELMRSDPWPRGTILKAKGLQAQDHSYIGIMPLNINSNSYQDWYFTSANIAKYFVWSPFGLNMPGMAFRQSGTTGTNIIINPDPGNPQSRDIVYSITDANIFAASFKALVFGVFKQYAEGLDWDEQPGSMNIDVAAAGLKRGIASRDGGIFRFTLPLYPGTGYPGIGMNTDEPIESTFAFWLKKDASSITVITRNMAKTAEYWDMAQAGMLIPYHANMQYPFPAVVAASSSGACSVGHTDYVNGLLTVIDVQIDYGRHHWMLTRGMPTFPTMATDSKNSFSQIALCMPDGTWQYFANQKQTMGTFYPPGASIPLFIINRPEKSNAICHYLMPTYTDLRSTQHVYYQDKWFGDQLTYQLESLKLVQDDGRKKNMLGYLPSISWSSIPVATYGEQTINGKRYMMLPNGWEDRRWFYRTGLFDEYKPDELMAMEDEITSKTKQMHCLIRLED